jgi:hypothetical protein
MKKICIKPSMFMLHSDECREGNAERLMFELRATSMTAIDKLNNY